MAKNIIRNAVAEIIVDRNCSCASAMQYAIITDRKVIPEKAKEDLAILVGIYL
jgi:5'-methylthioadenosine phosphorylase